MQGIPASLVLFTIDGPEVRSPHTSATPAVIVSHSILIGIPFTLRVGSVRASVEVVQSKKHSASEVLLVGKSSRDLTHCDLPGSDTP